MRYLHWHIIPRYEKDMSAPRGGVRFVISEMGDYKYNLFPSSYLQRLVSYIKDLPWRLPHLSHEPVYVISSSVLPSQEDDTFIFWDFVYPSKKYALNL
jgi:hypothetical protein